jgi:DNA-binding CsgD family transcriptional regulator
MRGDPDAGLPMLDEAVNLFSDSGNVLQLSWALVWLGIMTQHSGDLDSGFESLVAGRDLLTQRNENAFEPVATSEIAWNHLLRGDLETAEATLQQALLTSRRSVAAMVEGHVLAHFGLLAHARGNYELCRQRCAESIANVEAAGSLITEGFAFALAGYAAVRLGDLAAARDAVSQGRRYTAWIPLARTRMCWTEAAIAAAEGRRGDALDLLYESLRITAGTHDMVAGVDALETLAGLLRDEDAATACRLLGAADGMRTHLRYVRFASMAADHAETLAAVKAAVGPDFETLWSDGGRLSHDEAIAYATRGRGPRQRPSVGWESLTPMERDVAALVAKGMSNPDIAAQLFISRNTVKAHLAHAYAKLGVAIRSELAAEVSRRELTQGAIQS